MFREYWKHQEACYIIIITVQKVLFTSLMRLKREARSKAATMSLPVVTVGGRDFVRFSGMVN